MTGRHVTVVGFVLAAAVLAFGAGAGDRKGPPPSATTQPKAAAEAPASSLDYWLSGEAAPTSRQAIDPKGVNPFAASRSLARDYALPGAVELSDGKVLTGQLYTTGGRAWQVYVDQQKRWRQIPFAAVLSITAIVVSEKLEPQWRWKAMGTPERVYTGRQYPTRRLLWRFLLADGSQITGTVKGQPISVVAGGIKKGPFALHERQRGNPGQGLFELIYVRQVVISRQMLERPPEGTNRPRPS